MSADDDRDRPLHRAGVGVDAGEVDVGAVVLGPVLVPEGLHGLDELVGDGAAIGEVGPDGPELRLQVADADAEREAPAAEHVQGRDLLGEHDGVALRHDHDPGRQPDPLGHRGGIRQPDERVDGRVLGRHR